MATKITANNLTNSATYLLWEKMSQTAILPHQAYYKEDLKLKYGTTKGKIIFFFNTYTNTKVCYWNTKQT